MAKAYYTNPVSAIWMAREYGMRFYMATTIYESCFGSWRSGDITKIPPIKEVTQADLVIAVHRGWEAMYSSHGSEWECLDLVYVLRDSMHLLEPQDDDQGEDAEGYQCTFKNGVWQRDGFYQITEPVLIDKRNGLAFHWPMFEGEPDA